MNCPYDGSKKIQNAWFYARKESDTPRMVRIRARPKGRPDEMATLYDNEAVHLLTNVRANDRGFYIYKSLRRPAKVFCVIYLDVLSPPHAFTHVSSPVAVHEGDTVHLKCSVTGNPVPTLHWLRQDADGRLTDTFVYGNTLTIHNVTKFTAGTFVGNASNHLGNDYCTVTVAVEFRPVIEVYESEITEYEYKEVTLMCRVTANPMVDLVWTRGDNSDRLRQDYRFLLTDDREMEASHQTRYLLLTIRADQLHGPLYGDYWCAISGFGSDYRRRVVLKRPVNNVIPGG